MGQRHDRKAQAHRTPSMTYFGPAPDRILCQSSTAGCGICCGADNFIDRMTPSHQQRLERRTQLVDGCGFDELRLLAIKDLLLNEEQAYLVSSAIPTCPFMGYVSDSGLGCLIHPSRHPNNEDIRDISVHDQATCSGFFCTAHTALSPIEIAIAESVPPPEYGRTLTNIEYLKALRSCIEETRAQPLTITLVEAFQWERFWNVVNALPHRDETPNRYGLVMLSRDGDTKRVEMTQLQQHANRYWHRLLVALSLAPPNQKSYDELIQRLKKEVSRLCS